MESRNNSTENRVEFDPMMHDTAFVLVVIILTVITISIFCTIYKIGVSEDSSMLTQLKQLQEQRMVAPHNTSNNSSFIMEDMSIREESMPAVAV